MDFVGSDTTAAAGDGTRAGGPAQADAATAEATGAAEESLQSWQTDRTRAPLATKIVVAGGFGVGKTTFVGSVSEIRPLTTEALMTRAAADIDDIEATPDKRTTTVAMDFGRITLDADLVLYLFGTPGQQRFWFMWDDVVRGAIGAVVMADTRRLEDCFPALDYFESSGLPYIVAVNHFEGTYDYAAEEVRDALSVPEEIPVVIMSALKRVSVIETLLVLVGHALDVTPE
ncbi:GTP-binding protein [Streptomyces sp. KR80]|uniref:GTP-binding protein n=1 Tax=Streptomyces sp. KR80 TaxID=3457426 RepID=UPI003FCFD6B0